MDHFRRRRIAELAPLVTDTVLAELARDPKGIRYDHSDALTQILNFIRNETPMPGRAFVYVEAPHSAYRVARMQGRGAAPRLDGPLFATEAEAVTAVILERLQVLGLYSPQEIAQ